MIEPASAAVRTAAAPDRGVRNLLQYATRDTHDRLHRHPGFVAVQMGSIGRDAYRALLARLYGFYAPFEKAAAMEPIRTGWLRADLRTLGMSLAAVHSIPVCPFVPAVRTHERRLGALYVAEGAALGGRQLARCLDSLLGEGTTEGRTFFCGRGAATAAAWQAFLAQLQDLDGDTTRCAAAVAAATETFAAFEQWLRHWEGQGDV